MARFAWGRRVAGIAVAAALALLAALPGRATEPAAANDLLNAAVWMQTAVEYRANCLAIYALARLRLDEALAEPNWTAVDQTGDYRNLPPAVILDLDETALDNSAYEAGLVAAGAAFDPKTWDAWIRAAQATAVPGALDFTRYADAKGVKVFYVTNRTAGYREVTRRNLAALGFPLGGNVETLLMQQDRPEWTGAKGTRFAYVAKDYRVLLLLGDNFGDFTDAARGSLAERLAAFERLKAHFGRDWLALPNPIYGSWEGAAYGNDPSLSPEQKRSRKIGALSPWPAAR